MSKRLLILAVLTATAAAGLARAGQAQELGPQRRLLNLGLYGTALRLDVSEDRDEIDLYGGGARLMVNLAPFSGIADNLLDNVTVGLFIEHTPDQDDEGLKTAHYGAEIDFYFKDYGGRFDPFLLVGVGRFKTETEGGREDNEVAVSPGLGIRIPLRHRFELRADVRDVIVLDSPTGRNREDRMTDNLSISLGLDLAF